MGISNKHCLLFFHCISFLQIDFVLTDWQSTHLGVSGLQMVKAYSKYIMKKVIWSFSRMYLWNCLFIIHIHCSMDLFILANVVDPNQLASVKASWCGSTLFYHLAMNMCWCILQNWLQIAINWLSKNMVPLVLKSGIMEPKNYVGLYVRKHSNQSAQLQRQAGIVTFCVLQD